MKKFIIIALVVVLAVLFILPASLFAAPGGNGVPALHGSALNINDGLPPYDWFGPAVADLATSYPGAVADHIR
jgi:hypothetical protein